MNPTRPYINFITKNTKHVITIVTITPFNTPTLYFTSIIFSFSSLFSSFSCLISSSLLGFLEASTRVSSKKNNLQSLIVQLGQARKCSCQILISFKITTRGLSFQLFEIHRALFRSPCYFRLTPDLFCSEASFILKTQAPNQLALAIVHPRSSPDGHAILFSSTFIMCDATQREQLYTMTDFPACNLNKLAPLITTITTSWHMQIEQLRRSRPHHLSPC